MTSIDRHEQFSVEQIRLAWVEVDGVLRQVTEFAGVPPKKRPNMVCPACGQRVFAKLGEVRAPHAAHRPDDVCSVSNGESALHFNVKLYLAQELRKASSVSVWRLCAGDERSWRPTMCNDVHTERWDVAAWDEVEIERAVGGRRPDVVLKREGVIVGAVEVLVSNPISAEKAADLARERVPWLEVKACPSIYSGKSPWVVTQPLRIERLGPEKPWRCDRHRAPVIVPERSSSKVEHSDFGDTRSFRRRRRLTLRAGPSRINDAVWWVQCDWVRVVEVTLDGVRQILLVGVFRHTRAGSPDRYSLMTSQRKLIASEPAPRRQLLNVAYDRWLQLCARSGAVCELSRWLKPSELGAPELEAPEVENGNPWRGMIVRARDTRDDP